MKMNKKGFTIVELVIVIAVIAILAGVLIPTFSGLVGKAQDSAVIQEARNKYTEYVGMHDYSDGTSPEQNLVIEVGTKYVAVIGSKLQDKVYTDKAVAKDAAKYSDNEAAAFLCEEHLNPTPEQGAADAFCDDCGKCVVHTWTNESAPGTKCTNTGCTETKPADNN